MGLNATRAVRVRHRSGGSQNLYSIGRVQTPTLALLVDREHAIRQFVPQDYWEERTELETETGGVFRALWTPLAPPSPKLTRFWEPSCGQFCGSALRRTRNLDDALGPVVETLKQKKTREPQPYLFDLTSLQRTANRRWKPGSNRREIAPSTHIAA